ncbi:hypothetical protein BGZ76_004879 [Entomortierella beljakovae]|nr:hypothetical protein BGZ76_004879 [Entomortierella beljakovae]
MKFTNLTTAVLAFSATLVAGQGGEACTNCLQTNLLALPKCQGVNITIGDFDPASSPEYAVCLCSSLDGNWVDPCKDTALCGADIESFKATYKSSMESAGLNCSGPTPIFSPLPPAEVLPTTAISSSGTPEPTDGAGKGSSGVKDAVPSSAFMKVMGALAIAVSVSATML